MNGLSKRCQISEPTIRRIAKKQVKLAVQRNRVKRLARESFRQHNDDLPCVILRRLVAVKGTFTAARQDRKEQ